MVTYTKSDTATCPGRSTYGFFKKIFSLFLLLSLLTLVSSFNNPTDPIKKVPVKKLGLTKKFLDGGDFSLDFVASAPYTYDHTKGGGAFDDRTIGKTLDVVESLEGGDFTCGDIVSFLTEITVDDDAEGVQTIQLDYSFLAHSTGQPGRALYPIQAVMINNMNNIVDADGNTVGDGPLGSDAGNVESGNVPSEVSFTQDLEGDLHVKPSTTTAQVTVTGLEAGETVIVRVDVLIDCQDNSSPTGNLQADITGARVLEPEGQRSNIQVGNQTVPFKNVDQIIQLACTIPPAGPVCPNTVTTHTATASVGGATYVWTVTGNGVIVEGGVDVTTVTKTAASNVLTSSVNVRATGAGSYTITANISKTGTSSSSCSQTVTVNSNVDLTSLTTPLTLCPGANASFTTTATGTGADGGDVTWWKGGVQIVDDANYDITVSGANSTLTILNINADDAGTYTAKIGGTGLCGNDEVSGVLNVSTNVALTALIPQTECPGDNAVFTSTATGTNADGGDITWWNGAVQITDDANYDIVVSGASSTLTILTVQESDEGTYTAKIGGAGLCGTAERSATLTVDAAVALTALSPQTQCPGSNAVFSTMASGTGADGGDVTWWKGGVQLADDANYDIVVSGATSTLTILTVEESDEGTYTARIGGGSLCGTAERSATLTVDANSALTALTNLVKCPGENAVFTSTASGTGADGADITWWKGATQLTDDNVNYDITATGATSTLTVLGVAAADAGTYTAKIGGTGLCGSDEKSATLGVNVAAALSPLAPVAKCPGENASFSTSASGTNADGGDVTWWKGATQLSDDANYDIVVSGASSTLTILGVLLEDGGSYTAKIGGAGLCGTDEESGILTVNPTPGPPAYDVDDPTCEALYGTLTINFPTPGAGISYTLNGVTQESNVFPNLAPGSYSLSVTNNFGCTSTAQFPIVVGPLPSCGETLCTYTQGQYGTEGGMACTPAGQLTTRQLIDYAIGNWTGDKIVIGSTVRSFTINQNADDVQAILDLLPGGGASNILAYDGNRDASDALPASMLKNGRLNNTLLAQTITLGLNLGITTNLANFELENGIRLVTASPANGCNTASTDIEACSYVGHTLTSAGVITFLTNNVWDGDSFEPDMSLDKEATVAELFYLASYALGSSSTNRTVYGQSFDAIAGLADQINNIFDGCQVFIGNLTQQQYEALIAPCLVTRNAPAAAQELVIPTELKVAAYPNPFNRSIHFNFVAPTTGKALLELYDLVGRRIGVVFEGSVDAGMAKAIQYRVNAAQRVPMIYKLTIGDKTSFGKLLPGNTD